MISGGPSMLLWMPLFHSFSQLSRIPAYTHHTFFIQRFVNGRWGCLHVSVFVNSVAVNIGGACIFFNYRRTYFTWLTFLALWIHLATSERFSLNLTPPSSRRLSCCLLFLCVGHTLFLCISHSFLLKSEQKWSIPKIHFRWYIGASLDTDSWPPPWDLFWSFACFFRDLAGLF